MNRIEKTFLSILSRSVNGEALSSDPELAADEWLSFLSLAREQDILPLMFEAVYRLPSFQTLDGNVIRPFREAAVGSVIRQIIQTNEFLTLIFHAQKTGLDPVVLKGIICRSLYPQGYLRPSVDDDLLVPRDDAAAFHDFLLSEGISADDPDADPVTAPELSYHKENSPIYIELQKELFDPDSDVFGSFNALFEDVFDRTVCLQVEDVSVRTLAPTDHLLYLFLHAFKHFVHSGIGIRTVCDIGLFAGHYTAEIDWAYARSCLEKVRAFDFARALLYIVKRYLLPDAGFSGSIVDWKINDSDVEPLLKDILEGGVHGNSSLERLHSSNITLNAVVKNRKEGPSAGNSYLGTAAHAVFLPFRQMATHYPYLKKAPFLLPAAWGQRIFKYLKERITDRPDGRGSSSESIRLGQSRVELLKKYGIIR